MSELLLEPLLWHMALMLQPSAKSSFVEPTLVVSAILSKLPAVLLETTTLLVVWPYFTPLVNLVIAWFHSLSVLPCAAKGFCVRFLVRLKTFYLVVSVMCVLRMVFQFQLKPHHPAATLLENKFLSLYQPLHPSANRFLLRICCARASKLFQSYRPSWTNLKKEIALFVHFCFLKRKLMHWTIVLYIEVVASVVADLPITFWKIVEFALVYQLLPLLLAFVRSVFYLLSSLITPLDQWEADAFTRTLLSLFSFWSWTKRKELMTKLLLI